jgi:hypothetical protein
VQSQGSRYLSVVVLALSVLARVDVAMADEATGTVNYKGRTATLKYAYLVKGPDEMDQETIIRRVILSQTDIGADIQACTTLGCCTNNLTEGVTVDLDAGPRLNYWVVLNDQLVQYSGTKRPTALEASLDEPGRVAGTLNIDDTEADGPKVEATFDAALLKEFGASH